MKKLLSLALFLLTAHTFAADASLALVNLQPEKDKATFQANLNGKGANLTLAGQTATAFKANTVYALTLDTTKGGVELLCLSIAYTPVRDQSGKVVGAPVMVRFAAKDGSRLTLPAAPEKFTVGKTYFAHLQ